MRPFYVSAAIQVLNIQTFSALSAWTRRLPQSATPTPIHAALWDYCMRVVRQLSLQVCFCNRPLGRWVPRGLGRALDRGQQARHTTGLPLLLLLLPPPLLPSLPLLASGRIAVAAVTAAVEAVQR